MAAMKRYLIILIIFNSSLNTAYCQSRNAMIDSLVKFGVITNNDRPEIQLEFKKSFGHASDRVLILHGLESIQLQKTYHINPHNMGLFYYSVGHQGKKRQDSVNNILHILLEKINRAGLLTRRVYTYTLNGIDSNYYGIEVQMVSHLAEMTSRLEWLAPRKLLPVAVQLYKNNIVSDSSFMRLESDIKNGKIESALQLNNYCRFDKIFNLETYPDTPRVWLEQLHHDVAAILPALNFTDFSYTTAPDTELSGGSLGWVRLKVSLTCNDRIYKYALKTPDFEIRPGKARLNELVASSFYRIFNKILADQQSPFRLHGIIYSRGGDFGKFAVIALRGEQTKIFMKKPCLTYMLVNLENYDNTLTSARVDSAIAEWRTIGLFAHLTNPEITKALDDAEADNLYSIGSLLHNFPGVVYSLTSSMNSNGDLYTTLLTHIAEVTHGAFTPEKITQKKTKDGVQLQYLYGGKIHSYSFRTPNGLLDNGFSKFMKGLAAENNLPGDFYVLEYEDAVIYLTKPQHDFIASHKSLNLDR